MKWLIAICFMFLCAARLGSQDTGERSPPLPGESAPRVIKFSGYEWQVKTSRGNVGPGPNLFGSESVKVDPQGYLHLAILPSGRRWICSEVISKRSFGFGEYRFVIRDIAKLDGNAVFGMFLWDTTASQQHFREVDIEISRWGETKPNAQFVIQPYVRPENLVRFELPSGRAELSFKWTPGRLLCRARVGGKLVREYLFTKGVPEPGQENARLNNWLFRAAPPSDGKTVEVIVESFKFLPLNKRR